MIKPLLVLKKIAKKSQKISIHLSIVILSFGVIFADYIWPNTLNTNAVLADSISIDQIDTKKADVFFSYLTSLVPPFDSGDETVSTYLTEGSIFLNKPSLTNTIISTLQRDKITTYTVSEGETYWTIAFKFELDIDTLLWANSIAVADIDKIKPGEELIILPVSGLLYTSVEGDTIQGISDAFKISVDKIKTQNKLTSNYIDPGTRIVLPGAKKYVPKPAPAASGTVSVGTPQTGNQSAVPNYAGDSSYYVGTVAVGSGAFAWPVNSGSRFISQYFGWVTRYYKHTGVDLDWRNGLDIIAADGGTVVAVGYGWGGGYGNHVIIDHGNGYQTLYAHLATIGVKTGQNVSRGQSIGVMGTTGISTGVHLHFEIRQNGVAINPLLYIK
uniref:M23 family metallopeptidase n=1 Tax=candidate division CPR3 bacterium TaxID=2268181 RepID=A0A7C4M000_UNCC3